MELTGGVQHSNRNRSSLRAAQDSTRATVLQMITTTRRMTGKNTNLPGDVVTARRRQRQTPRRTEEDFRAVGAFGIRLLDSYFADSFEGWFKHGASQSQNDSVSSAAMPQDSDREFREALKNAYDFFKARYPIVIESLTRYASYAADGAALTKLVKTIQDSARNARSRDSGKMRGNIFDIIANAPDGPPTAKFSIVNPPLSKDSKSGRCYQHPQLAMLLAPREFVIDLCFTSGLKRKSALEDLKNGRARLSDETLFSFLYNLEKFNNSSQLEGLFRGYTLLRAIREKDV
ncbi:hypothetical protein L218DRAFT_768670 [Marasmius fiardii PR-910]|nr:hypothetical protein L218DRAFT_768670 [Marasmius fiardii PR-910]